MDISNFVNLIVNNGTAIAVIVYFCLRDWKFQETLLETLTTLKQLVADLKYDEEKGGN